MLFYNRQLLRSKETTNGQTTNLRVMFFFQYRMEVVKKTYIDISFMDENRSQNLHPKAYMRR